VQGRHKRVRRACAPARSVPSNANEPGHRKVPRFWPVFKGLLVGLSSLSLVTAKLVIIGSNRYRWAGRENAGKQNVKPASDVGGAVRLHRAQDVGSFLGLSPVVKKKSSVPIQAPSCKKIKPTASVNQQHKVKAPNNPRPCHPGISAT
jgi:hypothetical protein